jgi:hypothetical protein
MSESRDYYVTMVRGKRVAWLLGPYPTHNEALALVDAGKRLASAVDPWSDFDAFGTSSLPCLPTNPRGVLNSKLTP